MVLLVARPRAVAELLPLAAGPLLRRRPPVLPPPGTPLARQPATPLAMRTPTPTASRPTTNRR